MKNIGIVGHKDNIKRIETVLNKHFPQVSGHAIEIHDMGQIETTITFIKEHIHDFDGIIFTGKILYDIMNHRMHSQTPWVYLENDACQLQRILLEASHIHNMSVTNISIDSYSENDVEMVYSDFGLTKDMYQAEVSKVDLFNQTLMEDLFNFHRKNYLNNSKRLAITGVSTVYNMLQKNHIPSMLLTPNTTAIKNKIYSLLEKIKYEDMTVSQIVVISLEIDITEEYDLTSENEYSIMLKKTRITEEVYKFAQRIQAAVVESERNYLMFTTKQIVEFETHSLSVLPILESIATKTASTVSVGIGFGITAREAKTNAIIGKNKALKMGGNQCFVVRSRKNIERITPLDTLPSTFLESAELPFKDISENSGVSVNSIYQLKCIMDIYKKDTFTSQELSEEFGNSLRSMNRIIEKLELAGYIEVVGKKIIGKAGRPSRILKLHI